MYHIFFIHHSSLDWQFDCLHVLAIVCNTAVDIGMQVLFRIMVFAEYMLRSSIAGSYGSSIFSSFLWLWSSLETVLADVS